MSSSSPALAAGLLDALPVTRRLLASHGPAAEPLVYGGRLPDVSPAWRSALHEALDLEVSYDPLAADPLDARTVDLVYGRVRADQVVLALSARTNLTLAGSTVRVVGDSSLASALTSLLRRIGAAVVRCTDDPVERLAAALDGLRVDDVAAAASGSAHVSVLTGVGHDGLSVADVAGLVADASPRPAAAGDAVSPRPHVHALPKGALVDMPSPLPTDDAPPTHAQRRLLDVLLAALIVDGGPDGRDGVFATAVTP